MFTNKVVVITGGAAGIGKCIAEEFEKAGATVCVIDKAPGHHFVGDISDKAVLEAFAAQVIAPRPCGYSGQQCPSHHAGYRQLHL